MTKERDYQELYDRLLEEVSTLHRNNRRRIRVGMRMLLAVTLGLMLLMFLAGGNKVFTLMLWILSMFAVAAYLIAVEYADYELQKKLENITQMEQESLGTLLELPELPKVPRMGLLLRHGAREEQETPETEPVPEETAAAAEDISADTGHKGTDSAGAGGIFRGRDTAGGARRSAAGRQRADACRAGIQRRAGAGTAAGRPGEAGVRSGRADPGDTGAVR